MLLTCVWHHSPTGLVSNDAELSQCLASQSICTIAANTVINSIQTTIIAKDIVIVGSGNSVIDLQSNRTLLGEREIFQLDSDPRICCPMPFIAP